MTITTLIHQRRRRVEQVAAALMFERHHPQALLAELLGDVASYRDVVDELRGRVNGTSRADAEVDGVLDRELLAMGALTPVDAGFAAAVDAVLSVVRDPLRGRDENLVRLLEASLDTSTLESLAQSVEVRSLARSTARSACTAA